MSDMHDSNEKKLLKELGALNGALIQIKQSIDSIAEKVERNYKNQHPPKSLPSTLDPFYKIQEAGYHQAHSDNRSQHVTQRIVMAATLIAAVAAAIYGWVAIRQWEEMIAATGASQQAVYESRMNRIQAEKSLDATIDQFHLDQRAWVGIKEVAVIEPSEISTREGRSFSYKSFKIAIHNSGKTPGIKMDVRTDDPIRLQNFKETRDQTDYDAAMLYHFKIAKKVDKFVLLGSLPSKSAEAKLKAPLLEGQAIPPDGIMTITAEGSGWSVSAKDPPIVNYIVGKITYHDIFTKTLHTTKFCYVHRPGGEFSLCGVGNSMD